MGGRGRGGGGWVLCGWVCGGVGGGLFSLLGFCAALGLPSLVILVCSLSVLLLVRGGVRGVWWGGGGGGGGGGIFRSTHTLVG